MSKYQRSCQSYHQRNHSLQFKFEHIIYAQPGVQRHMADQTADTGIY